MRCRQLLRLVVSGGGSGNAQAPAKLSAVRHARSQLVAGVHYKLCISVIASECGTASAVAETAAALSFCTPQVGSTGKDVAAEFLFGATQKISEVCFDL